MIESDETDTLFNFISAAERPSTDLYELISIPALSFSTANKVIPFKSV